MKNLNALFVSLLLSASANAQTLADSFKPQVWGTYIFVSTTLPRATLIQLAKEASLSKSILVFNGMGASAQDLPNLQKSIAEITEACCQNKTVAWVIHPKLYERYAVKVTPTFVVAKGDGKQSSDFALVAGDMSLGNALKFIAQGSQNPSMRSRATDLYLKTFSGN